MALLWHAGSPEGIGDNPETKRSGQSPIVIYRSSFDKYVMTPHQPAPTRPDTNNVAHYRATPYHKPSTPCHNSNSVANGFTKAKASTSSPCKQMPPATPKPGDREYEG